MLYYCAALSALLGRVRCSWHGRSIGRAPGNSPRVRACRRGLSREQNDVAPVPTPVAHFARSELSFRCDVCLSGFVKGSTRCRLRVVKNSVLERKKNLAKECFGLFFYLLPYFSVCIRNRALVQATLFAAQTSTKKKKKRPGKTFTIVPNESCWLAVVILLASQVSSTCAQVRSIAALFFSDRKYFGYTWGRFQCTKYEFHLHPYTKPREIYHPPMTG